MINVRMQHKEVRKLSPKITVLGVGGAGGNAVNNMISSGLQGCEFIVCNTDAQALDGSLCENKIQLGATVTGGLGAGAKPDVGRMAAEESLDDVMQYLEGSNMAFITAGMGGGTGTGAAPVIARACREKGVLTVGVVTKPFHFEGSHRMAMAEDGIAEMQDYVDTLIVIPNQNLFRVANEKTTFAEAFKMADSVLQSGVRGVTDLMVMPGLINLDFADIRSAMLEMGKAMMGTGDSEGDRRAIEAAEAAINNPLLDDVSMQGARGVIINVTGGMDMTLFEVDEACNRIREEVDPDANIIFGSTFDEGLEGIMRVSVVATGIDAEEQRAAKPGKSTSGGSVVNKLTGQLQTDRKMGRAQPNVAASDQGASDHGSVEKSMSGEEVSMTPDSQETADSGSAQVAQRAESKPGGYAIPSYGPMTASAMAGASASARMVTPAAPQASSPMAQRPETSAATPPAGETALRGAVHENAFIPPKPVEVDQNRTESASQPLSPLAARRYDAEPPAQTVTSPGLTLRPPVPGAGTQARKKTPSLFERFAGPLKGLHGDHGEGDAARGSGETSSGSAGGGAMAAPQRPVQQGSLNIEAPKKADHAEDELDIPAFLRRQAN